MWEYDFGIFEDEENNGKIKDGIQKFILANFEPQNLNLKKILFLQEDDPQFPLNAAAFYDAKDNTIALKYEQMKNSNNLTKKYYNLAHEIQHSENNMRFLHLFKQIKKTSTLEYVKLGIETVIDEYTAEYAAKLKVPEGTSGNILGISRIYFDIKDKRTKPLDFYIMLINIIPQALGEADATKVMTGENLMEDSYNKIPDFEFKNIILEFEAILNSFSLSEEQAYIEKCGDACVKLLKFLQVDFDFLKQLDEYMKKV